MKKHFAKVAFSIICVGTLYAATTFSFTFCLELSQEQVDILKRRADKYQKASGLTNEITWQKYLTTVIIHELNNEKTVDELSQMVEDLRTIIKKKK